MLPSCRVCLCCRESTTILACVSPALPRGILNCTPFVWCYGEAFGCSPVEQRRTKCYAVLGGTMHHPECFRQKESLLALHCRLYTVLEGEDDLQSSPANTDALGNAANSAADWKTLANSRQHCPTLAHTRTHLSRIRYTRQHSSKLRHSPTHSNTCRHAQIHSAMLQRSCTHSATNKTLLHQ